MDFQTRERQTGRRKEKKNKNIRQNETPYVSNTRGSAFAARVDVDDDDAGTTARVQRGTTLGGRCARAR